MDPTLPGTTGFGAALAQSALSLVVVCALAWWALRWGARRNLLPRGRGDLEVLERVPLDPGRALYLVRAGPKVLVVGGAEGSLTNLAELRPEDLPARAEAPAPQGFAEILGRLRERP